ncbi:hypothetical protein B0J12DRAFT_740206 [Macrophomina phaseolina]|nr:hypothetical protein B0J12DRAFT_740206 [Macrophomina phaseolina]
MPRPWPENRPFVAKVDYQPTNTYRIPLHKNDLGRVVKQDGEQCFVIIESRGKPGEKPQVWIPTRLITIGDVEYANSVEELSLESGLPNASTAASNVKFAASTDGNSGLLGVLTDWINKLSTRCTMQSYVDPILEGIPGPLRNVFSPANFILEDIRQNAKKVTGSEDEAGVYMIVVADFKKGSTYEDKHTHIYIGKTIHFEQRLREHRNATRSKQAVHRAWSESSDHEMYIICRLEGQGHEDERKRIAAEQLFTCLFETYDPILSDPTD